MLRSRVTSRQAGSGKRKSANVERKNGHVDLPLPVKLLNNRVKFSIDLSILFLNILYLKNVTNFLLLPKTQLNFNLKKPLLSSPNQTTPAWHF
jgi:hypothetical protein